MNGEALRLKSKSYQQLSEVLSKRKAEHLKETAFKNEVKMEVVWQSFGSQVRKSKGQRFVRRNRWEEAYFNKNSLTGSDCLNTTV